MTAAVWTKVTCQTCAGTGNVHTGGSTLDESNYGVCPTCGDYADEDGGQGFLWLNEQTGEMRRTLDD